MRHDRAVLVRVGQPSDGRERLRTGGAKATTLRRVALDARHIAKSGMAAVRMLASVLSGRYDGAIPPCDGPLRSRHEPGSPRLPHPLPGTPRVQCHKMIAMMTSTGLSVNRRASSTGVIVSPSMI
jgi:hypothetical protein